MVVVNHVTTRSLCNQWQNWHNNKIRHIRNAKDITDMEYVFLELVILNGCWAKVIFSEINSMIKQMILFFNALKTSFKTVKLKNYSVGSKQTTVNTKNAPDKQMKIKQTLFCRRIFLRSFRRFYRRDILKGSPDPNNFNFGINVGKSRIRHRSSMRERLWNWTRSSSIDFESIQQIIIQFKSRSMSDPTLSDNLFEKIKWLGAGLNIQIFIQIILSRIVTVSFLDGGNPKSSNFFFSSACNDIFHS